VKTSSPISYHGTVEHRATPRALVAHHAVTECRVHSIRALAVCWGHGLAKGRHRGPANWALVQ
jgi:hypothetical protein